MPALFNLVGQADNEKQSHKHYYVPAAGCINFIEQQQQKVIKISSRHFSASFPFIPRQMYYLYVHFHSHNMNIKKLGKQANKKNS